MSSITLLKGLLLKFQCANSPLPTPLVDTASIALLAAFDAVGHSLHFVIPFHFSSKILAFLPYLSTSFLFRLRSCSLTVPNSVCVNLDLCTCPDGYLARQPEGPELLMLSLRLQSQVAPVAATPICLRLQGLQRVLPVSHIVPDTS